MEKTNLFALVMPLFLSLQALAIQYGSNVPNDVAETFNNDLQWLESFQGSGATESFKEVFEVDQFSGPVVKEFILQRVHQINYDPTPTEMPFIMTASQWFGGKDITIRPEFMRVKDNFTRLGRLALLLHEARHNVVDEDPYPHETCPVPFNDENGNPRVSKASGAVLAGLPACDSWYDGSYGIEAVFAINIIKHCTNCSADIIAEAKTIAANAIERLPYHDASKYLLKELED